MTSVHDEYENPPAITKFLHPADMSDRPERTWPRMTDMIGVVPTATGFVVRSPAHPGDQVYPESMSMAEIYEDQRRLWEEGMENKVTPGTGVELRDNPAPERAGTDLGNRLRSAAVLADQHPEWTGVAVMAHLDTVTLHVSCDDKNAALGFRVLAAAMSAIAEVQR